MRVPVTGGTGFTGSAAARELLSRIRRFAPLAATLIMAAAAVASVPAASGAATRSAGTSAQPAHSRSALQAVRRAASPVTPRVACSQLATFAYDFHHVPDAPTVILSAAQATYNGAAYCEVAGYITPQEQFDLKLPVSTYTGRYLQEGCGGDCGADSAGTPFQAANCPLVTGNGLALGADNQGHVSLPTDGLWASQDPALRVSFGYASEHALAQAAKAIIAAYYGAPPAHSYFDGCSGGGHEALAEAQRYPRDFNGILAGAPGIIWTQLMGVMQTWMIAVNMNAQGHEILGSEKLPELHAAVLKTCGNSHGLISDPRSCDFNPAAIQCPAGTDSSSCLTPAQVRVARDLYLGPHDGHGHYLYPGGEPYGSELAWADAANLPGLRGWLITPSSDAQWPRDTVAYQFAVNYLKYMGYWKNPPASFNLRDFRFTVREYDKLLPLTGIYNATDPDLSAFRRAGGKLIIWQGWADQAISPFGTVGYYEAVVRQEGGYAASQGFSRLYMIPGQYHCMLGAGGSPQVSGDLLDPLIRWAEQGTAPGTISFPLVQPTARLKAISVQPLNPLSAPPGGQRGLNTRYRWIGKFRPGGELWCHTQGMDLACSRRPPPISYATDTNTRAGPDTTAVRAMAAAAAAAAEGLRAAVPRIAEHLERAVPADLRWRMRPDRQVQLDLHQYQVDGPVALGDVDFISGGAITNAALYALLRIPEITAAIRVIEPETLDLSNLNRYALALASMTGWLKTHALTSHQTPRIRITGDTRTFSAATAPLLAPLAPRLLVGVDHIPSRWVTWRRRTASS